MCKPGSGLGQEREREGGAGRGSPGRLSDRRGVRGELWRRCRMVVDRLGTPVVLVLLFPVMMSFSGEGYE